MRCPASRQKTPTVALRRLIDAETEIRRLRALNAQLLEALEWALPYTPYPQIIGGDPESAKEYARLHASAIAAIAHAKGQEAGS